MPRPFISLSGVELLEHQGFAFHPTRFEVWKGGKLIKSGASESPIRFIVGEQKYFHTTTTIVELTDPALFSEVAKTNEYDIFVKGRGRAQMMTVPDKELPEDCVGLTMCRQYPGSTRLEKTFAPNEPYCCNLFFERGLISKTSFSINYPEKLVEFYSE